MAGIATPHWGQKLQRIYDRAHVFFLTSGELSLMDPMIDIWLGWCYHTRKQQTNDNLYEYIAIKKKRNMRIRREQNPNNWVSNYIIYFQILCTFFSLLASNIVLKNEGNMSRPTIKL